MLDKALAVVDEVGDLLSMKYSRKNGAKSLKEAIKECSINGSIISNMKL